MLMLMLNACATNASRTFTVDVSPISMQYTPRLIHDFFDERGYQRVAFERSDDSRTSFVLEVRTATIDEQRFRLKSAPQIEVIARLEKFKRMFDKSNARVVVQFIENGRSSLSEMGKQHYERLLAQVAERLGAGAVRQ